MISPCQTHLKSSGAVYSDTNTKLFPISLSELANVFIDGGNYNHKLEELCHSNGMLSDDGDSIVDKYSGWKIDNIQFSEAESYNEQGFIIKSRDVLKEDLGKEIIEIKEIKPSAKTLPFADKRTIYDHNQIQLITALNKILV
mgnify:CR=1 FL=1